MFSKKILNSWPLSIISYSVIFCLCKIKTWAISGRHHKAPIDCLEIIWVDPLNIKKYQKNNFYLNFRHHSGIIDGDWDIKNTFSLGKKEDYPVYTSLVLHFKKNIPWEKTPLYYIALYKMKKNPWHHCDTIKKLKDRFKYIDKIYYDIKKNGYKEQKKIRKFHCKPPELDEIKVAIARDGEILLADGFHRLTIAQILKIEKIPVRILVRHKQWQKIRDNFTNLPINEKKEIKNNLKNHPDLNFNKKIAFFIPSLRGGGAERVFVDLANNFAKRGLSVDLVLAQKEGPYLKDVSSKVNIIDLKSKRVLFSLLPLIKYLKSKKPDSLISAIFHANIITLIACLFCRCDVIVTEHSPFSVTQKKLPLWKRFIVKTAMKLLYGRAKTIVTVSNGVAEDFVKKIGIKKENLHTIYNPVDIKSVLERSKEDSSHKWLKNKEKKVLLGVGRLTEQKDFSTLIKAFVKLRKKKEIKLIILGEGKDRKSLEKLIKELQIENDVDMPGFIDNPYSCMANSDIFALSSEYEGFGNVLVEAMACGTPVVSTDCPCGPSEILDNGKYGKLVPVGDINDLAGAIEETLENPIEKKLLQERAKYFSVEKITKEYIDIMKDE
jgi:glycosyltransferase involved in cell wall biosynthesis